MFMIEELPVGITGLLIAGVFAAAMSSLSSSINSLASAAAYDFWAPLSGCEDDEVRVLRAGRVLTLIWASLLIAVAIAYVPMSEDATAVEVALTIASLVLRGSPWRLLSGYRGSRGHPARRDHRDDRWDRSGHFDLDSRFSLSRLPLVRPDWSRHHGRRRLRDESAWHARRPAPMSQPPVRVVGVDGGATRTRCVLADSEGRTLAKLGGGAGLLGAGEDRQVADRIIEQVTEVALRAGVPLPVDALCAGLAGAAGRAESQDLVDSRLKAAQVARKVRVVPDQEVAFMDAFGHGDGILIISGTGSVAAGRVGEGPLVRVGGWGALIGDEGSGYRIGLGGLRAAMRAADGRNVPTALTPSLFSALGAESVGQVFQWSKTVGKAGVAALAPRVIEEANGGTQPLEASSNAQLRRWCSTWRPSLAPSRSGRALPWPLWGGW